MKSSESKSKNQLEPAQTDNQTVKESALYKGGALYKSIVPNIPDAYKRAEKRFMVSVAPLLVFVVLMFPSVVLYLVTKGSIKKIFLPIMIVGVIGFVVTFVISARYGFRMMKFHVLKTLINEVQAQEESSLENLSIAKNEKFGPILNKSLVNLINRLIETENLEGYKVDADAGKVMRGQNG